jgi:hypothetical protein
MPPTAPLDLCFSMKAISLSDELSVWKSSIGPKALGFIEKACVTQKCGNGVGRNIEPAVSNRRALR